MTIIEISKTLRMRIQIQLRLKRVLYPHSESLCRMTAISPETLTLKHEFKQRNSQNISAELTTIKKVKVK